MADQDDLELLRADPKVQDELYGSAGQQVGTALEGAASAATLGLSTLAERELGVRGKDIQNRAEANPVAHTVGQIGGLVGSSLLLPGGGVAGGLEEAGLAGSKALGLSAETAARDAAQAAAQSATEAGLTGKAVSAAASAARKEALSGFSLPAKIGANAVKFGIENAGLQGTDEVSKMLSSDPNYSNPSKAAETALTNVGLSAAGGALLGAGTEVLHPLWNATVGTRVSNILGELKTKLMGGTDLSQPVQNAVNSIEEKTGKPLDPAIKGSMAENPYVKQFSQKLLDSETASGVEHQENIKGLNSDLKNYVGQGFGLADGEMDTLPDTFSENQAGDEARTSLSNEIKDKMAPGLAEEQVKNQLAEQAPTMAASAIERTPEQIQNLSDLSNEKRGNELGATIKSELQEKLKPTIDAFNDISNQFKSQPLEDADRIKYKEGIQKVIADNQLDESPSSPQYKLAKQLEGDVDNFKTMESGKRAQTRLNDYQYGSPEYYTAKQLKGVLRSVEGDMIEDRFAFKHPEMGSEARDIVKQTRQNYGQAMDLIESLNDRLHVGSYGGPDSFSSKLSDLKSEDILRRMTNPNDAGLLKILRKDLPKSAEMVRQAHLDRLAGKSAIDGSIDAIKLHQSMENMAPELRDFTLSENQQGVIKGLRDRLAEPASGQLGETLDQAQSLGKKIGLGKIDSVSDLFERLEDSSHASNETVINRLSKAMQTDAEFAQDLKSLAPETFKRVQEFEKKSLLLDSMNKDGELDISKLTKNIDKKSPEWRQNFVPPELSERIEHAQTLQQALPEKIGKSGTPRGLAEQFGSLPGKMIGILTGAASGNILAGIAAERMSNILTRSGPDAVKLAILKFLGSGGEVSSPAFMKLVSAIENVQAGNSMAAKAIKAVIHGGEVAIPSKLMPTDKKLDKLDKTVERLQYDQEPLINRHDQTAMYAPEQDAAHGQAMTQALGYLASIKPGTEHPLPFDEEPQINPVKKAEYHRALEIAEQPLVVLHSVQDGTLTEQDVTHLAAMYPNYYGLLKEKVMNEISDEKAPRLTMKKQMMLSLFMGAPLTSALEPQSIMANQGYLKGIEQQQAQKQQAMQEQALKGGGKSLNGLVSMNSTPLQSRQMGKIGMS